MNRRCDDHLADGDPRRLGANRRTLLRAGAATVALGGAGLGARIGGSGGLAQGATVETTPTACVLTPDMTEGPFYLPLDLVRKEITEGTPGVPLRLRITVQDVSARAPLAGAAVDIWHCDAQGYYSGVTGEPGGGASANENAGAEAGTFLRGIQLTAGDGVAEFATIYPGWYSGRTVHIHLKVHVGGTPDILELSTPASGSYEGGQVVHTAQLFFDDSISDEVYAVAEPYGGRNDERRMRNDADNILGDHEDEPGFLIDLVPLLAGSLVDGFVGTITIGVDPSAVPAVANGSRSGEPAPGAGTATG